MCSSDLPGSPALQPQARARPSPRWLPRAPDPHSGAPSPGPGRGSRLEGEKSWPRGSCTGDQAAGAWAPELGRLWPLRGSHTLGGPDSPPQSATPRPILQEEGCAPDPWGSRTFVHPVEDLIQVAFSVAVLVFLPHGAVFTPQHHELAVPTALGGEVGDLHDDRAGGTGDSGGGAWTQVCVPCGQQPRAQ